MGRWLSIMGSSLVSLVSLELGSLGLSLEKGASLGKFLTGLVQTGSERNYLFFGFLQFPCSRRLRDNRQQLPGNVPKTLKSFDMNKKKGKRKRNKNKEKQKKTGNTKKSGKGKRRIKGGKTKTTKMKKKERKTQAKCKHDRETQKKEIHSNPIYTNTIESFPNRGDDLVGLIAPKYCTLNFCRVFRCNVITSVTSKYSQEFNLLYLKF